MHEQTKAVRDISTGSSEVSKQIKLISKANAEHSRNGTMILQRLREVSEVSSSTAVEAKAIGASIGGSGSGEFRPDTPAEAGTDPRRRGREGRATHADEVARS
jgi:Ni,Fe-hydrogenase III large subunit